MALLDFSYMNTYRGLKVKVFFFFFRDIVVASKGDCILSLYTADHWIKVKFTVKLILAAMSFVKSVYETIPQFWLA